MVLECFLIAIFAATTSAQELCAIVYLAESHTCCCVKFSMYNPISLQLFVQ